MRRQLVVEQAVSWLHDLDVHTAEALKQLWEWVSALGGVAGSVWMWGGIAAVATQSTKSRPYQVHTIVWHITHTRHTLLTLSHVSR